MKKIITSVLLSSLVFTPAVIAETVVSSLPQVQHTQANKEDLIVVAARAIKDRSYKLALRVANNVTDLFPGYATGYLYRAMAAPAVLGIALFRLGEVQAAKLDFDKAKRLYYERLKSVDLSADQRNEAQLGLEAIELHLQLLRSNL